MAQEIKVIDMILDPSQIPGVIESYNNGDPKIVQGLDELEAIGFVDYFKKEGKLFKIDVMNRC